MRKPRARRGRPPRAPTTPSGQVGRSVRRPAVAAIRPGVQLDPRRPPAASASTTSKTTGPRARTPAPRAPAGRRAGAPTARRRRRTARRRGRSSAATAAARSRRRRSALTVATQSISPRNRQSARVGLVVERVQLVDRDRAARLALLPLAPWAVAGVAVDVAGRVAMQRDVALPAAAPGRLAQAQVELPAVVAPPDLAGPPQAPGLEHGLDRRHGIGDGVTSSIAAARSREPRSRACRASRSPPGTPAPYPKRP